MITKSLFNALDNCNLLPALNYAILNNDIKTIKLLLTFDKVYDFSNIL